MAVKIRLQRHGNRNNPFYRMVATESRMRRDGRFVEILGTYDPCNKVRSRELALKLDRIEHWLGVGAQPTDTAASLIRRARRDPSCVYAKEREQADEEAPVAEPSALESAASVSVAPPEPEAAPASSEPADEGEVAAVIVEEAADTADAPAAEEEAVGTETLPEEPVAEAPASEEAPAAEEPPAAEPEEKKE